MCQKHYRRFKSKLDALAAESEELAEQFDAKCVADGWAKEKQVGGRPKHDDDPFDEIADLIVEGRRQAAEAKERYETNPPKTAKKTKGRKKSG